MTPTIGILGGMGPRATVDFEQLLLGKLPGSDQQIPPIICINDGRIPDRSSFLLGIGSDPVPAMLRGAQKLERLGVSFICLPCNTACAPQILPRLQAALCTPVINLPSLVVNFATSLGLKNLLLLATAGTVKAGTYQRLCQQAGIGYQLPTAKVQQKVTKLIAAVKAGAEAKAGQLAWQIRECAAKLDCDGVILGCTELPSVGHILAPPGVVAIDTLDVLANAAVQIVKQLTKEKQYEKRPIYA